ncbi:MAG TPA: PDZ domain-containing protein [Acidimicrobiia bacterium]
MSDASPELPVAPEPDKRRRRGWAIAGGVVAVLLAIVLVGAYLVRLPYVIISPGAATPVEDVVSIRGATTYPHRGSLLFLTVKITPPDPGPNLYRYLAAELDDDSEILGRDDYLQGRSAKQDEQLNTQLMTQSQLTAKVVALRRLGYPVTITGAGAIVAGVGKGSPASGKLEVRDVITAVDGTPVSTSDEIGPLVRKRPPGAPVTFAITRKGVAKNVTVVTTKGQAGDANGKAFVGVATVTKDQKVAFTPDIRINPGAVSGPSAGLAFTLTIIDELTPGNLTGGKKVAVTGEILPGGLVGPVGGVAQKAAAAHDAGARLFLVPPDELKEARSHAHGMKVVAVSNLDAALNALHRAGGAAVPPPPSSATPR